MAAENFGKKVEIVNVFGLGKTNDWLALIFQAMTGKIVLLTAFVLVFVLFYMSIKELYTLSWLALILAVYSLLFIVLQILV